MGADSLFVRVQDDTENRWSLTQILNNISGTLPLTLLNLAAVKDNNNVILSWQTTNEVNTAYFNVQRSEDAVIFTTVGKVNATGNGSLQKDYSFNDNSSSLKDGKVFYRLQMMDNDGKYTYSKIVYVNVITNGLKFAIYPNPARSYFIVKNDKYTGLNNADIIITDLAGRKLIRQKLSNSEEQRINITTLSKGVYLVRIGTPGNLETRKLFVE